MTREECATTTTTTTIDQSVHFDTTPESSDSTTRPASIFRPMIFEPMTMIPEHRISVPPAKIGTRIVHPVVGRAQPSRSVHRGMLPLVFVNANLVLIASDPPTSLHLCPFPPKHREIHGNTCEHYRNHPENHYYLLLSSL